MALANVVCVLVEKLQNQAAQPHQDSPPKNILMIDWDLEAPGLHKYFHKYFKNRFPNAETRSRDFDFHPGLIDFFNDFRRHIDSIYSKEEDIPEVEVGPLLHRTNIDNYILATDIPYLSLLKAGRFDDEYSTRVSRFDWERSFSQVEQLFTIWAEQLTEQFSYVLIDSRTGTTDTSYICSMLMPEKLVAVFTPNSQSLTGITDLIHQATQFRSASDDLRPLVVFPLPSRIDLSEQRLREYWRYGDSESQIEGYQPTFEGLFQQIYRLPECNLNNYFGEVQIQHVPRYSYGEDISVLIERKEAGRLSLSSSYRKFADILLKDHPWAETVPDDTQSRRIEIVELEALSAKSSAQRKSYDFLGALITSVRATKKLQRVQNVPDSVRARVLDRLYRVTRSIREINRFEGHGDDVWDVSFDPSGDRIVSASEDRTLKLWRRDGELLANLVGHGGKVRDVSFSPLGNLIASASEDRTVRLWEPDGTLVTTLKGHRDYVLAVCFSPDGQTIVSAGYDRAIKIWGLDGTLHNTLEGHEDVIWDLSFHPDGHRIASASEDGTVRLWTVAGEELPIFSNEGDKFFSVSFSPDGTKIAAAGERTEVNIWYLNGELFSTLRGHQDKVYCVAFSADGTKVATASEDKSVRMWSPEGEEIDNFKGHANEALCVRFHPQGNFLASGGGDNSIRLWTLEPGEDSSPEGHDKAVLNAIFSPDGECIASCSNDHFVKLWDLQGNLLRNFKGDNGHSDTVRDVCFQPKLQPGQHENDRLLISAGDDETIKLWLRNQRSPLATLKHGAKVRAVNFNPDGNLFVSAGAEATLKLWDFEGNLVTSGFEGHQDWILDAGFSPDGSFIGSASADGTLRLWNLDGEVLTVFQDGNSDDWIYSLAFSPDGKTLASSGTLFIKLWDVGSGRLLRTFEGHEDTVYDVEFSPDGQTLLSASHDQTLKHWSLDGVTLGRFNEYHNNAVRALNFSPNGNCFLSSSYDRTVKLWDINCQTEPIGSMPRQDTIPDVDVLMRRACSWLDEYLWTNQNVSISDRYICSDVLYED
jgi:WD40 repeat protein